MRAIHYYAVILAALILTCVWAMFSLSAKAAECTNYEATVAAIEAKGHHPFFIAPSRLPKVVADAERITGDTYGTASRGFLLVGEELTALGLEVDGCLLDPILIKNPRADVGA